MKLKCLLNVFRNLLVSFDPSYKNKNKSMDGLLQIVKALDGPALFKLRTKVIEDNFLK